MAMARDILATLKGVAGPGRVVPPSGISAWLVIASTGIMVFLATLALAFALTAGRVADRWEDGLAAALTIRLPSSSENAEAQLDRIRAILETTPGLGTPRVLDSAEQAAYLEPWFGAAFDLSLFALPHMIDVPIADPGFDPAGLRNRLEGEVPTAELEDHRSWRAPMAAAAGQVRSLGMLALLLIFAALAAIIVLACQAAMIASTPAISTLRLIGARDSFVARAFVRRITLRALLGAVSGILPALALLALVPRADPDSLGPVGLSGAQWLAPLALLPLTGIIALLATAITTRLVLKGLP